MTGHSRQTLAARLSAAPAKGANAKAAAGKFKDFAVSCSKAGLSVQLLKSPRVKALLLGVAEHAPYLWRLIEADFERALAVLNADPAGALDHCLQKGLDVCNQSADENEVMLALRKMKQEAHLLIALADLGGVWDIRQIIEAISRMADVAVSACMTFLLRQAAGAGKLKLADMNDPQKGCGVVVLALGKHGAKELNYSSDIDLVVFYDPLSPALESDSEAAPLFVRMTRSMVKILQERTGDGYVLRVDLRLRPDPGSTSVAISLPAAFDYYESYGQNWERAAFIKARPVAGDIALGEQFIAELAPFIWRKYFDYAAIADIHAMKRQIHAVRGHAEVAVAGHDVKLGRGGIREIEFFVQTQQLIFGGRRPELRGRQTLAMLDALQTDGWVTPEANDELSKSYGYLRTVEHRLQMMNDEQTQRLPSGDDDLAAFAAFCGYKSFGAFSAALSGEFKRVEFHYARLFEHAPGLDSASGSLVFTGTTDDPDTLETLKKMGFQDASRAIETIRGWHFGRRAAVQSPRAREVLTELVPALLESLSGSGDPDAALAALDHAMSRMPAAVELFSILKSNKDVRNLFGDILGGAPRLAQIVAQRPHVLDAAIDPDLPRAASQTHAYSNRLELALQKAASAEDALDIMRDIFHEESFLISIRTLAGTIDPREAGVAFTALAESMIISSLESVMKSFEQDHGVISGAGCAIFGLGKLGSREMTATSDLDLVLVYTFEDETPESDGQRPLHVAQYYSRLTQRLISALTVSTRRGGLYDVDMRLRPSGRKGPLATRLDSFRAYQLEDAETWEHMSLTRARFIAGDASLGVRVRQVIHEALSKTSDSKSLAKDVFEMRRLIATEKGENQEWDLKLASGGIIDIEFIAQYLCLKHARTCPQMLASHTYKVLELASDQSFLRSGDARELMEAHSLYSAITQMTRLTIGEKFDPADAGKGVLQRIANSAACPDFRSLERDVLEKRQIVRKIFNSILNSASS